MALDEEQRRNPAKGHANNYQRVSGSANDDQEAVEWFRYAMRLGVSAAFHPFEYAKILIQLGYEPIPPVPGRSLFGRPIMCLPNIFQYASHIRKIDGLYGWYRGLTPKLVGSVFSMMLSEKVVHHLGLNPTVDAKDTENLSNEQLYMHYKAFLKRDLVLNLTGIIAAHPFHVISLRMMAQFIGREKVYNSVAGSIIEIYRTEGIQGFFAGLVPKLIGDLLCLALTSTTVYLINKYLVKDKNGRQYSAGFTQYTYSAITYPMNVVSTCMAVTGAPLIAGRPPIMPEYKNWWDCMADLYARGEMKRGNAIFWRSAPGVVPTLNASPMLPIISKYH